MTQENLRPHPPQINLLHCGTPRQPIYLTASRQCKSTSSALSESQSYSSKQDKSGHDRREKGLCADREPFSHSAFLDFSTAALAI